MLTYPPVDYASYLIRDLLEAGTFMKTGMSPSELTWQEIQSWAECTGTHLSAWDATVIKRLSIEYVHQLHVSKVGNTPPPYTVEEFDRAKVSDKIGQLLRGIASRRKANARPRDRKKSQQDS